MKNCPAQGSTFKEKIKPSLPITRRDFLKAQLKGAFLLGAAASGLWLPDVSIAGANPDIGLAEGGPGPAARAAVGLIGGMERFVKKGAKVVIKPNMSFASRPEEGTNTHPLVVKELVAMCHEAGASRVLVLDNPLRPEELCLELSGIRDACRDLGDPVKTLKKGRFFREAAIPGGASFKKTEVMHAVLDADVLIAAPVAKSHSATGVSLSMKGMMGLIKDRGVMHWAHDLDTAIVDLCTLLRPHLVVVDVTRVLSTNGPFGPGKVIRKDTVLASTDMVAADAMAVSLGEWYGRKFEPGQVKHIRLAHERGLGSMDVDSLRVKRVRL